MLTKDTDQIARLENEVEQLARTTFRAEINLTLLISNFDENLKQARSHGTQPTPDHQLSRSRSGSWLSNEYYVEGAIASLSECLPIIEKHDSRCLITEAEKPPAGSERAHYAHALKARARDVLNRAAILVRALETELTGLNTINAAVRAVEISRDVVRTASILYPGKKEQITWLRKHGQCLRRCAKLCATAADASYKTANDLGANRSLTAPPPAALTPTAVPAAAAPTSTGNGSGQAASADVAPADGK